MGVLLTKAKQEKRAENNVATLKQFKDEVAYIQGLKGDHEFSSAAIKNFVKIMILDKIYV